MSPIYDDIGINYADLRVPDPHIATVIHAALGEERTILNVGAGTGAYEPPGRDVTAIEPSAAMIARRPAGRAQVIQGVAERLPFPDNSFDASMAVLTVHHWSDVRQGLDEMRRVTRGPVVILTFDPSQRPWLTDYFPRLITLDEAKMPPMALYEACLGAVTIEPELIPEDCTDGFLYAYWKRPQAYLDERIRSGSSSFWAISEVSDGVARLREDLASGTWHTKCAELATVDAYDAGYRMIVSR